MSSLSRFGKAEADVVKSIHSDQTSKPDEGKRSRIGSPAPPFPHTPAVLAAILISSLPVALIFAPASTCSPFSPSSSPGPSMPPLPLCPASYPS